MAVRAPNSVDVTEIQFKLHQKSQIFNPNNTLTTNIHLVACASNYGLIFIGHPNKNEINVIRHENLVNTKENNEKLFVRSVTLPNVPNCLAVSSDGSLLAVNYTHNGSAFLSFYTVAAFLSAEIPSKINIRVSAEENVKVKEILWNPVVPNMLAVVLNNGALGMYGLKESGFEFHSIDKQERAQCACWSPKGKQIVVGFPNGKFVQYKPDLKPARTIACPNNIHEGPFNTVAIQWLSNYQFAAVFLQEGEEKSPALYIINAPKTGNPVYINYGDITFSSSESRESQIVLLHVPAWNILIMANSNSMEAGILGTKETGETPTWVQYTTLDEARIELPLTSSKEDTFPIGIVLDTGSTHQVTMGENKLPIMPMIHVVSTHGLLISFNFLNLTPNAPGICSPPNTINDTSGLSLFRQVDELLSGNSNQEPQIQQQQQPTPAPPSEISFTVPSGATSTPAPDRKGKSIFGDKPGSLFGAAPASGGSVFGGATTVTQVPAIAPKTSTAPGGIFNAQPSAQSNPATLNFGRGFSFGQSANQQAPVVSQLPVSGFGQKQSISFGGQSQFADSQEQQTIAKPQVLRQDSVEKSKPLYTIPPTYTASPQMLQQQQQYQQQKQQQQHQQQHAQTQKSESLKSVPNMPNESELHGIIKQLIATQIQSFEFELKELSEKSRDINISIGDIDEIRQCTKRLNDLQELNDLATEKGMETEIQGLRHSLNESFGMIAEVKSKLAMFHNPELSELATMSNLNQTNRRQMIKLRSLIATNEAQIKMVQQQIDAQWSNYQDLVGQNSRTKMHIPSLEGIYQTLTKHKDILAKQRHKLNYIKSKLGVKGLLEKNDNKKTNIAVDSLADSILSMSLSEQVKGETSQLTNNKLNAIRSALQNRKIIHVKPQRPDCVGLNSEVILETKTRAMRQREGAVTKPEKMEQQRIKTDQVIITKPTATKPLSISNQNNIQIKKVEPKPLAAPTPIFAQKTQTVKTTPKQPLPLGASNIQPSQQSQQKDKSVAAFTIQPTTDFKFGGNVFGKPGESMTATTSANIFTGGNTNEASFFRMNKPEPTKQIGGFPDVGSVATSISDNKGVEKQPKTPSIFSVSSANDKSEANKEQTPTSFTPKVIAGDNKNSLSYGFSFASNLAENQNKDKLKPTAESEKATDAISSSKPDIISGFTMTSNPVATTPSETNLFAALSAADSNVNKTESFLAKPTPIPFSTFNIATKATTSSSDAGNIFKVSAEPLISSSQKSTASPGFSFPSAADKPSDESSNVNPTTSTPAATQAELSFGIPSSTAGFAKLSSPFSFASLALSSTPAISSTTSEPTTTKPLSTADATDNLFGSLNICKPAALGSDQAKSSTANIFAGGLFASTAFSSPPPPPPTEAKGILSTSQLEVVTASSLSPSPISTVTTTSSTKLAPPTLSATGTPEAQVDASANKPDLPQSPPTTTVLSTPSLTPAGVFDPRTGFSLPASTTATPSSQPSAQFTMPESTSSSIFGNAASPATTLTFGIGTSASTGIFANAAATTSSPFATTGQSGSSLFGNTSATTAANVVTSTAPASTSASIFGTASATTSTTVFGTSAVTTTTSPFGIASPATSVPAFGSTPAGAATPAFGSTSTSTPGSAFLGTSAATSGSAFGTAPGTSTTSVFGNAPATTSTSIFGATPVASTGNIFGGIPKPDQSVFATATTTASPFGAGNASVFAGPPNQLVSGGNIFGASPTGTLGFGAQPAANAGSLFGGSAATSQPSSPFGAPATSSIFGTPKTDTTTNVFGSPPQNQAVSGGSLFGASSFGSAQSGGSLFGGSSATPAFASGGAFSQASSSPFAATAQQSSPFSSGGTPAFGQNTFGNANFGSPNAFGGSTSPGGSFVQGGPSISQTGFGAPGAAFNKPVFGGSPSFGNAPTFGGGPTFGGSPTFGSPKSNFGSFATPQPGAFSPPSPKNNLFEALGASDTGLSFGNLAQNANANAAKPQFGGSSFSSWRES